MSHKIYPRTLQLAGLLNRGSYFLFGPRSTGKTTLIKDQLMKVSDQTESETEKVLYIDLLKTDLQLKLLNQPSELVNIVRQSGSKRVVIDEIQLMPVLLHEVHRLIEESRCRFLLTGSSARKLRRGGSNLLGGRARMATLFPLVAREIKQFSLNRFLSTGGLPRAYFSDEPWEELKAYVQIYLQEEVRAESLVRSLPQFSRFLSGAALSSGQLLSYTQVASDAQVKASTVRNYFEILEDTLLGVLLQPFAKTKKRKSIQTPKFFMFDVGVANALTDTKSHAPKTPSYGVAFEQFIFQELRAFLAYTRSDESLSFWRSIHDQEVDFCLGETLAVEVKAKSTLHSRDLSGLRALKEEGIFKHYCIVNLDEVPSQTDDGIEILPWSVFLQRLWTHGLSEWGRWE